MPIAVAWTHTAPATSAAIEFAVAMPIDANGLSRRLNDLLEDKAHQGESTHWRSVSRGIADAYGSRPAVDRCRIKTLDRFRIAARGVLGDIHHLETERNCVAHSAVGSSQEEIVGPALGIAADGAGTKKSRGF